MNESHLVDAAWQARSRAVCPHSGFAVGAALQDSEGNIWTGANVENASYTLGLCAERVALMYALAQGKTAFRMLVIATDTERPTPPCGACRQLLWEFAPDAEVIMVCRGGPTRLRVKELLPFAFDVTALGPSGRP